MKSRVYDRLKHLGGDEVCARLGDIFIGTIHGYCSRLLEDHFGYGDYGVLDENQEMAFLMRIGWELGLNKKLIPRDKLKKKVPITLESLLYSLKPRHLEAIKCGRPTFRETSFCALPSLRPRARPDGWLGHNARGVQASGTARRGSRLFIFFDTD
jgi:hypothetical protein